MTRELPPGTWRSVQTAVTELIVTGTVLVLVGGVIAYAAWPAQDVVQTTPSYLTRENGSVVWAIVGCTVLAVGQVMATIGTVAVGVRLGTRD